jgi:hypothetical protein
VRSRTSPAISSLGLPDLTGFEDQPRWSRIQRTCRTTAANFHEEEFVSAKITMTNGTQFVTTGSATAATLTKAFERRSFAEVESTDGTVYINPAHVAYIRDE